MPKVRVLIADDHAILRAGLKLLIQTQPDLEVAGDVARWDDFASEVARLQPDVVTVDLTMPGGDAFAQIREIKRQSPSIRIVVLTMHEDAAYFRAAIAAGADGYVLKRAADTELLEAIRCVMAGRIYTTMQLAETCTTSVTGPTGGDQESAALSAREREVLQFAAQGLTNREVAERLFLSVKTVESYRARLMAKLQLKTRAELVRYAIQQGLLER